MVKRTVNDSIKYDNSKSKFLIVRTSSKNYDNINIPIEKQISNIIDLMKLNIKEVEILEFIGYSAYNQSYYSSEMDKIFNDKTMINKEFYYYSIDRFSRNVPLGTKWLKMIEKNNNKIFFVLNELNYPCEGNYQRIVNILVEAQTESEIKGRRAEESAKFRRNRNIFRNTNGYGNNFNRHSELLTIILIKKLLNASSENLENQYIKSMMIKIIKNMQLEYEIKKEKIRFIKSQKLIFGDGSNYLRDNQTYEEICDLFESFGIGFIKNDGDEGEFKTKSSDLTKKEYPIENTYKTLYSIHINEIINDLLLYNVNYNRNQLIKFILDNNKNINLDSYLKKNTTIIVPDDIVINEENKFFWIVKYKKSEYKLLETIIENHELNLTKEGFKEKLREFELTHLNNNDDDSEITMSEEEFEDNLINIQEQIEHFDFQINDEEESRPQPKKNRYETVDLEFCKSMEEKYGKEHELTIMAYRRFLES